MPGLEHLTRRGLQVYNVSLSTKQMLTRLAALSVLCSAGALAANSVKGELIANGDKVQLSAVAVEAGLDQVGLLMTDKPLPAGCGVYDAFVLAGQSKLRGMAVSISKDTKQKESAGINGLYHESWGGQLGNIGEPEFQIEQFDEEVLRGSVSLAAGSLNDHKFSYSVKFDVSLKIELAPIEVTISGATDSEPAKGYIAYYKALMAGSLEDGKKFVVKENAEQMTGEDADLFLEFFQDGHPREATILSVDQKGKEAKLSVEGVIVACTGSDKGTATIEMVREDGSWKVKLESWEM